MSEVWDWEHSFGVPWTIQMYPQFYTSIPESNNIICVTAAVHTWNEIITLALKTEGDTEIWWTHIHALA